MAVLVRKNKCDIDVVFTAIPRLPFMSDFRDVVERVFVDAFHTTELRVRNIFSVQIVLDLFSRHPRCQGLLVGSERSAVMDFVALSLLLRCPSRATGETDECCQRDQSHRNVHRIFPEKPCDMKGGFDIGE